MHLYCALHPMRSTGLAYHCASSPGLPGIITIPSSCSDELREESVSTLRGNFSMDAVLSPSALLECWYLKWGRGRGAVQPGGWSAFQAGAVVQPAMQCQPCGCPCWPCPRERHPRALPVQEQSCGAAAEHTSAPLCHGGATKHHRPVIKKQIFQRKICFNQFRTHFKADFNHCSTSACFLLMFLDLVSVKFSEGLFSELNRSASQLSQPQPHFWMQSAVFQLCVWSCVSVLPDLSSCSTLLLTANGSPF